MSEKTYICDKCVFVTPSKHQFSEHIKSHENNLNNDTIIIDFWDDVIEDESEYPEVEKRDIESAREDSDNSKEGCESDSKNSIEKSGLGQEYLNNKQISESFKWWCCEHCSYKTENEVNLQTHLKTHIQATTVVKCNICEKEFSSRSGLRRHIMNIHLI